MAGRHISNAGPDFKRITRNLGTAIARGEKATVQVAALQAKRVQEREIARVVGADMSMSGVGKAKGRAGGAKVGARFKLEKRGGHTQAYIKATGPLHLVERRTNPHLIRSAYIGGSRASRSDFFTGGFKGGGRGGKGVLKLPDGNFRRSAYHPGTSGQEPWEKGLKKAKPLVEKTMRKQTTNILKKAGGL